MAAALYQGPEIKSHLPARHTDIGGTPSLSFLTRLLRSPRAIRQPVTKKTSTGLRGLWLRWLNSVPSQRPGSCS
ncbi:Hypothetical predicted protein, partial [Marmota monax]